MIFGKNEDANNIVKKYWSKCEVGMSMIQGGDILN